MNDLESKAYARYITQGNSGLDIRQINFLDCAPVKFSQPGVAYQKTLESFMQEDIVPTALKVRSIYVPHANQDIGIEQSLNLAFKWFKNNQEVFEIAGNRGENWDLLPPVALAHHQTIAFAYSFIGSRPQIDPKLSHIKVAFETNTKEWENDIRACTLNVFDSLRQVPLRIGKEIDPRLQSTSLNLERITQFLWSDGINHRIFASDALTAMLIGKYWLELKRRAQAGQHAFA